jgi:hypothetical protein
MRRNMHVCVLGILFLVVMRFCCSVVYISDNRSNVWIGLLGYVGRTTQSINFIHHIRSDHIKRIVNLNEDDLAGLPVNPNTPLDPLTQLYFFPAPLPPARPLVFDATMSRKALTVA